MPAPIIIFSVDAIRGNILLNTLRFNGLEAVLQNRIIHVKEVIRKNNPPIVILDIKELLHNELDLIKSAYSLLSNTPLIVLANQSEIDTLELNEMRTEFCKTDPLDAELIISKVNALLEQKNHSATVQQNNSATVQQSNSSTVQQSNSATEQQFKSAEVQKDEEPDDDSENLEDDLKKFLDLE